MRHIIEDLGIADVDVIGYSGALATLSRGGKQEHPVVDVRLSSGVALSILERALDAGIACWWYSGDRWYVRAEDEIARYEAGLTHMSPIPMGDDSLPAPHKLLATGIPGTVRPQLEALRDHAVAMGASSQFSNPHSLEIVAEGVSKAVALQRLTEARGISLSDVVAIGDGPNDAEMLRVAGYAVAMANAAPETVDVADGVTGTNDEDGVAGAIERLGLNHSRSIDTHPA